MVASSLATASLPSLSKFTDGRSAWRHLFRQAGPLIVPIIVVLAIAFVLADSVVLALFGPEYADAVPVFRVFILAAVLVILNQSLLAFLQARHAERFAALTLMLAVPAIIGATWVGAVQGGALGASFGYLAGNLGILASFLVKSRMLMRTDPDPESVGA
jgi:O-antigen/teichoic acid export membrane protein